MQAIDRAIASSGPSAKGFHVCVKSPDDPDNVLSFNLGSYRDVQSLAEEIRQLGYELTFLHPVMKHCDFVLEPHRAAPAA